MARVKVPSDADWNEYYAMAEHHTDAAWQFIEPRIKQISGIDTSMVLDFACGKGRIAQFWLPIVKNLILSDINREAIEFCKERFSSSPDSGKIRYVVNDAASIPLEDNSVSFIYSWDAMVHFDFDLLKIYFKEFSRILKPGGFGFIHHSNFGSLAARFHAFTKNLKIRGKRSRFNRNPGWRAGTTAVDVKDFCRKNGLITVNQEIFTWHGNKNMDCLTTFKKP